jgi:hypothetical protein
LAAPSGRRGNSGARPLFCYPRAKGTENASVCYDFNVSAVTIFFSVAIQIAIITIDLYSMTIPDGLVIAMILPAVLSFFVSSENARVCRTKGGIRPDGEESAKRRGYCEKHLNRE